MMRRSAIRAGLLVVVLGAHPTAAHAQDARGAVVPQTITVGDVFHAAARVSLPPGAHVEPPDTIAVVDDVESAGRVDVSVDSTAGGLEATVVWPLAAWRPGDYQLPPITVRVVRDGAASDIVVALPAFTVSSVLPADTAGVEPRAAKDVLGANRVWWPIVLAVLLALAVAVGLYIWWRRRRRAEQPGAIVIAAPPRELALEQLRALAAAGLLERGDVKRFYATLTETLRHYAAAVDPAWSGDLTTAELSGRLRSALPVTDALELVRILGEADLVKFARARPPSSVAVADLEAAVRWVGRVGPVEEPGAEQDSVQPGGRAA
ncbi:MAG: DUF4381 family protein [Gemmatimonadota bacterium]